MTSFMTTINHHFSRQQLLTFWTSFQTSGAAHTIETFIFEQSLGDAVGLEGLMLGLDDLQPWSNIRFLLFNVRWGVGLTDDQLLTLASAWPCLEEFTINAVSGWRAPSGGITPEGLRRLLQTCRSLTSVGLAVDARRYTEPPAIGLLESLGRTDTWYRIDVLDSVVEAASVPALAAFFAWWLPHATVSIDSWKYGPRPPGWEVYKGRWDAICQQARTLQNGGAP